MSKYDLLWKHVQKDGSSTVTLTFDEITSITGFEIDHSFLSYKKELPAYGYQVDKISMKEKTVGFSRIS